MRGKIIAAGAPYIQDVVLTGLNMKEVGAMVFPTPAVRTLSGLPADAPLSDVLASAPVLAHFQNVVNQLASTATGSANRIARLCLLSEPPTIDKGEITDKGSINHRCRFRVRRSHRPRIGTLGRQSSGTRFEPRQRTTRGSRH